MISSSGQLCFEYEYERSPTVRKLYAVKQLCGFVICLLMMYVIAVQYLVPVLRKSLDHDSWAILAHDLIQLAIPWFIIWLLASYAFFHCWLNFLAEITRFGDRLFFRDWWNTASFDAFWRKWNILVHEWV